MRDRAIAVAPRVYKRARQRAATQDGFTLAELLVVLAILGVILAGLTALFTGGLKTQTDQTNRTQAQQDARLALDKLRREIHCASGVTSNNATTGGTWPATGGTNAITIALGSYCPTNAIGTPSVTWCTKGGGPFTLWRYPHTTDLSTETYANACKGSGTAWTGNIADSPSGGVTSGKIFTGYSPPTNPAMPAPLLTYSTKAGSLTAATYAYIVDPMIGATEQPGTEATITVPSGTTTQSITVDWSGSIPSYPGITGYRVYGRAAGAEQLLCQWPAPATPTCNTGTSYTDTATTTPLSPQPQSRRIAMISVDIPVRVSRLFELRDNIALRNTPP
jgi:prepilin-type N-terminal cleavage/methylation domain-containing protein